MPWSGGAFTRTNGVHTGATLWVQDRDAGTKILAARHDTHDQDLAGGINSTLEKSGSNAATGNLNIGSNRLTAVADGTAKTDAATVNQLQSNAPAFQATDTGTANAHVIALSPAITAYAAGQAITFKSNNASTTTSTVNVNGLGVKTIKKKHDKNIEAGDIEDGSIVTVVYDGTNFQMTSQAATDEGLDLGAVSGIIESNANFVDQVIFGPSVDGMSWRGHFSKASVWTSLMLATVETSGSDAQVNIWDLTAGTLASATPLATLTLSGATPTSIAASMGYIIVGTSDQGVHICDPHGGAWAERTNGWPRTLKTSTSPLLGNDNVVMVAAKVIDQSNFDSRTGGLIPTFGTLFASGESKTASIIKTDGNVWDITQTAPATGVIGFQGNDAIWPRSATDTRRYPVNLITADMHSYAGDSYAISTAYPQGFAATTAFSSSGNHSAWASTSGASIRLRGDNVYASGIASINRTYNTGYLVGDIRGAWLANSVTADRSHQGNTLTQNGTVTEAVVASGAELKQYSGFSSSNYLTVASNADWDETGTGSMSSYGWARYIGNDDGMLWGFGNSGNTIRFHVMAASGGTITGVDDGATATASVNSGNVLFTDGAWHHIAFVRVSSTERHLYVDGILRNSSTTDAGSLTSDGNLPFNIGVQQDGSTNPANNTAVSLVRMTAAVLTASMVRKIYEDEAPMYAANAKVLLQSGSTDAVLDAEVDPLSKKVIVTQTDTQDIFDGLAIETERTIATGGSTFEHGLLFGDAVAEINNANLFASTPATDQRQVNEMTRALSADLPTGIDFSKAKAWLVYNQSTNTILSSFNIESVTDVATGRIWAYFAVPFKNTKYVGVGTADATQTTSTNNTNTQTGYQEFYTIVSSTGALQDAGRLGCVWFGELENE